MPSTPATADVGQLPATGCRNSMLATPATAAAVADHKASYPGDRGRRRVGINPGDRGRRPATPALPRRPRPPPCRNQPRRPRT